MAFEITSFATHRLKARFLSGGTSHWVILTVIEGHRNRQECEITMFFDGPGAATKASAYAEAINSADRLLHPLDIAREIAAEMADA